jgi:rhodanese-related sulfurtransferase
MNLPPSIPASEAVRLVAECGAGCVVDVRAGAEFDAEHIAGCRLIPLDAIEKRADELRALPSPCLLLCRSGNRAAMAQRALQKLQVTGVTVVEGGLDAYLAAGGSTVKGRACMSIERQVRIAAGSLVVIGVALGFLVHPACFALSGFVGAGLVFAGITDFCGLGLLLCKMPWNRSKSCQAGPAK